MYDSFDAQTIPNKLEALFAGGQSEGVCADVLSICQAHVWASVLQEYDCSSIHELRKVAVRGNCLPDLSDDSKVSTYFFRISVAEYLMRRADSMLSEPITMSSSIPWLQLVRTRDDWQIIQSDRLRNMTRELGETQPGFMGFVGGQLDGKTMDSIFPRSKTLLEEEERFGCQSQR